MVAGLERQAKGRGPGQGTLAAAAFVQGQKRKGCRSAHGLPNGELARLGPYLRAWRALRNVDKILIPSPSPLQVLSAQLKHRWCCDTLLKLCPRIQTVSGLLS